MDNLAMMKPCVMCDRVNHHKDMMYFEDANIFICDKCMNFELEKIPLEIEIDMLVRKRDNFPESFLIPRDRDLLSKRFEEFYNQFQSDKKKKYLDDSVQPFS